MKSLDSIKIALNKNTEVVLLTEVTMKSDEDNDTLFLNFFTILNDSLRMSILAVGNLSSHLGKLTNTNEQTINQLLTENPQQYAQLLQTHTQQLLVEVGEEYSKIMLNSQKNSNNARAILASMISNGYYKQKVNYHFPSGIQKQEEKVDVSQMKPAFKQMLEIVKRYDDEKYLKELGV